MSFAIITPSYAPDYERCALLVESLDRCCPAVNHYIIVDRRDMALFRNLASDRTRLIEAETLVESWLHRTPGRRGFWVSVRAWPVRGWIMQQIYKIAAADVVTERVLVFCDSDVTFLRPFNAEMLLVDGGLGLLDISYADDKGREWTRLARELLGLPQGGETRGHVGNMICWRRDLVLAMRKRIEEVQGVSWQLAIARLKTFSEYILYGVFVREVIGYSGSGHQPSDVPLVKPSWGRDISNLDGLTHFFNDFDPRTVAVMAHSKDAVDHARYRAMVEAQWRHAGVKT